MRNRCVGALIDVLDGYYERALIKSINAAAREEGFNVFFVPGHRVNAPRNFDRQFNAMFALASCPKIDALISATETLQSQLTRDQCLSFLGRFAGVPLINLNFVADGMSSVVTDDRVGMRAMMRHLIVEHGYTKFAFMRGIEAALGAQVRFEVFMDSLSDHGLTIDPKLIVTGNFVQLDARIAMGQLLDSKIPFEVLVCANDGMAQGAIEVATERGLRVPQDIAVTGFDDVFSFARVGIPMTTIAQPFQELAQAAMQLVKAQLNQGAGSTVIHTPTQLVLRDTCGCVAGAKTQRQAPGLASNPAPEDSIIESLFLSQADEVIYRGYAHELLHSVVRDEARFLARVEQIATATLRSTGTLGQLQHLLLSLYASANRANGQSDRDPSESEKIGQRIILAQIILASAQNAFRGRNPLMEGPITYKLQDMGTFQHKMTDFDRESMFSLIEQSMRTLSIPRACIVLYSSPAVFESLEQDFLPQTSQLIFATSNYERQYAEVHRDFPTRDILPGDLFSEGGNHSLALLPIFQYSQHYGYLILDVSTLPTFELELVREEISSALIGSILLAEVARARDLLKSDLSVSEGHNVRLVDEVIQLNRRLQALFDAALEVAIIATDPHGNMDVFNLGAEKMLGYRADEVLGKSPALFHVPSEVERRSQALEKQLGRSVEGFETFVANTRTGVSEIGNWTYVKKDGQQLQVSLVVSAVIGSDGVINGFLIIGRDITEQIRAEANLLALNQQLDLRVQQRTQSLAESTEQLNASLSELKLTQSKLVQAEKLAALGSIVSAVAHELNTPLGNCITVATALEDDTMALQSEIESGGLRRSRLDSYLAMAQTGIQMLVKNLARAVSLVDNFKLISVSESQTPLAVFNLKEVVIIATELFMQKSKDARIDVQLDVPDDIMLKSYPHAIEKVISALMSNSLSHGFEGRSEGRISIAARLNASTCSIAYQDDGVGMTAQVLAHIFDPFFTTQFGKGGNGLGMSICHNLVTGVLGGTIEVKSAVGVGSSCFIDIPARVPAHD